MTVLANNATTAELVTVLTNNATSTGRAAVRRPYTDRSVSVH